MFLRFPKRLLASLSPSTSNTRPENKIEDTRTVVFVCRGCAKLPRVLGGSVLESNRSRGPSSRQTRTCSGIAVLNRLCARSVGSLLLQSWGCWFPRWMGGGEKEDWAKDLLLHPLVTSVDRVRGLLLLQDSVVARSMSLTPLNFLMDGHVKQSWPLISVAVKSYPTLTQFRSKGPFPVSSSRPICCGDVCS